MKTKILIAMLLIGLVYAGTIKWESDLVFSHQFHAEEAGAECETCHQAALTSTTGKDDLLPEMETCYDCHDEEMACTACHEKGEEPDILPRIENYSVKFNHKLHAEKEAECLDCHAGVGNKEQVNSGLHLPNMDICMSCHATPAETEGCYLCHLDNESLVPPSHAESWNIMHGTASETGAENCNSCHQDNYCIDCHQGENLYNQSHSAEFIATHAISWQFRETDCSTCHSRDYCIECHIEVNYVKPVNHSLNGWNGVLHAREAKTNYDNCSVCHSEADVTCTQCHY